MINQYDRIFGIVKRSINEVLGNVAMTAGKVATRGAAVKRGVRKTKPVVSGEPDQTKSTVLNPLTINTRKTKNKTTVKHIHKTQPQESPHFGNPSSEGEVKL